MPDLSPFELEMQSAQTRQPTNFEILSLTRLAIGSYTLSEPIPGRDQIPGHELWAVAKSICAYPDHTSEGAYAAACQNAAGELGLTLDQVTTLANRALFEINRYPWLQPIPVILALINGGCRDGATLLY